MSRHKQPLCRDIHLVSSHANCYIGSKPHGGSYLGYGDPERLVPDLHRVLASCAARIPMVKRVSSD